MTKTKTIFVKASNNYPIIIGNGILGDIGTYLKEVGICGKAVIITDDNVDKLYFDVVANALKNSGYDYVKYVFANGEGSKTLATYADILSFLATNGISRKDFIIALGGGVVGDLAGFVSATYLRGINYVQVPTTLLAQIDSSVGGKTAIDLKEGKNLVGAFKQPKLVVVDTSLLQTLPNDVFLDGLGELTKYALLDSKIFEVFSLSVDKNLDQLIALSIEYKTKIVELDEFELCERKLLNLGHTPAHGVEKLSNYTISHGKAVAMGLKIIINGSYKKGFLSKNDYDKITAVLGKYLPDCNISLDDLASTAFYDKKRSGNTIDIITIHGIGDCRITKVDFNNLKEYF